MSGHTHQDASLLDMHDALLCDLDGVVYAGPDAVPHAVDALVAAQEAGIRVAYCTNNASRTPEEVAEHISSLGIPTTPEQVFGSSRAAAQHARQTASEAHIQGPTAYVVGTEALRREATNAGFKLVDSAADQPDFVLQGFNPDVTWRHLAEAGYAITAGARWIATNTDATIPRAEGIAPGNGTLVAAVAAATGQEPLVTGKPAPTLMQMAARAVGAQNPLVIGDRLDTDVAGGNAAGFATALVLTGVDTHAVAKQAKPGLKPCYVLNDLRDLHVPAHSCVLEDSGPQESLND